jgi:hypothetical protein
MTTPLNPTLRSWASLLSFLDGDLAAAIESLARRLEVAMTAAPHSFAEGDMPDGYDGIDSHGELDHLLLSEWLLAEEEPFEFIRKLALGELSYLHRERVDPQSPTRFVVLADVGPDQLGAPRLAHLAGLVVLARRAEAQGVALELGLLSDPPGEFHKGQLPELFVAWLRARTATAPTAEDVEAWIATLAPTDHAWLFSSPSTSKTRQSALRHLTACETEWGPDGATALGVAVDGRNLHLPLPSSADSVRVLRGQGIRRPTAPGVERATRARFPRFTDHTRRLLCRGEEPEELITIKIPRAGSGLTGHPKKHRFSGPVVAAATFDTRVAALIWSNGSLKVEVLGRRIAGIGSTDLSPSQLGLDTPSMEALIETTLETMLFQSGDLMLRLSGEWWRITPPDNAWKQPQVVAAIASKTLDQPQLAQFSNDRFFLDGQIDSDISVRPTRLFIGPDDYIANELSAGEYSLANHKSVEIVRVDPHDTVLGIVVRAHVPFLVVHSAAKRILRLVGPTGTRTLTAASGDLIDVAVHPTEPLMVVQRRDGSIEAFDLPDGAPLTFLVPELP